MMALLTRTRKTRGIDALDDAERGDAPAQADPGSAPDADEAADDAGAGDAREDEPVGDPVVPLAGFDLLEGEGRRRRATRKATAVAAAVAVAVLAASGAYTLSVRGTHAGLASTAEALDAEIKRLNQDIREASNSVLPEATLAQHREDRRAAAMEAQQKQLPYTTIYRDMFALASELGIQVNSVTFKGSNTDSGLVVSGIANDLATVGRWTAQIQTRFGLVSGPGGYVEKISNTYQTRPEDGRQQFSTVMRVSTDNVQLHAGCSRVAPYLEGEVGECDAAFQDFVEAGEEAAAVDGGAGSLDVPSLGQTADVEVEVLVDGVDVNVAEAEVVVDDGDQPAGEESP